MIPTVSSGSVFPGKQKKMNDGDGKKWKGIVTPDRKAGRQSFLEVRIAEGQKESLTRGDDGADQMWAGTGDMPPETSVHTLDLSWPCRGARKR